VHTIRTHPSIEIASQTPFEKTSFEDDISKAASSRASSTHSIKTAFHYSRETIGDPNKLSISTDKIIKTHSLNNIGSYESSQLKARKVASDNSLKKLSLKKLPSLLRSLSSQSTIYFNKKKSKLLNPRQTHSIYRSADNMPHLASNSRETISHRLSDSNLKMRRATAYELYDTEEAQLYDSESEENIEDEKSAEETEKGKLIGDITGDCSGGDNN
jgi:hypothetical protein